MRDTQIPRPAFLWLLATAVAVLIPHVTHLPIWLIAVVAGVLIWRWLTHLGRLSYPGRLLKTLIVIAVTAGVVVGFGRHFSLESATAFLLGVSLLKLLEMRDRRDGYVVIFISCFILGVGFLFQQGILAGLYGIACVWLIITTLVALHSNPHRSAGNIKRSGRQAALILLASLPMMLVLYLLFPRLAPLWNLNLHSSEARTGLSETMSPGDIASLSQSDELAFRVKFDTDQLPARDQLYWRALILNRYDGRRWRAGDHHGDIAWYGEPVMAATTQMESVSYEIIQEPTDEHWLFSLRGVIAQEQDTGVTMDYRLIARKPVYNRIRYRALSYPSMALDAAGIPVVEKSLNLQIPLDANPQAQQFADNLIRDFPQPLDFSSAVLRYFREQPFYYTLRPPVLGEQDIDQFLFTSRRGFCAHYAGAFVFMARAAGIPARVVTGYQGGEWNDAEKFLTVRQYDAHAWAEIWVKDKGWIRVDPTAAVAPERIDFGLEMAVRSEGSFLEKQTFSAHKMKAFNWLNQLRLQLDSMNYYWQRWVLSYDRSRQTNFFQNVLGLKEYQTALTILGGSLALFFLIASTVLWWQSRPQKPSPFMQQWQRLQQKGRTFGVEPVSGETPSMYLTRLAEACPDQALMLQTLSDTIETVFYRSDMSVLPQLLRHMIKVRRALSGSV